MIVFDDAHAVLATRLATLGTPTAWTNTAFTPTAGAIYFTEQFQPAGEIPLLVAGNNPVAALYTITAYAPLNGTRKPANQAAQAALELFPRGLRVSKNGTVVTIRGRDMGAGFVSGDRWAVPVTLRLFIAAGS